MYNTGKEGTTRYGIDTRTIHRIEIVLPDDALAGVDAYDQVEIVLRSRNDVSSPKRLTYRDLTRLLGGS